MKLSDSKRKELENKENKTDYEKKTLLYDDLFFGRSEKTHTKGNVIVEDIKIDDILYEFEHGCFIKSKVLTLPTLNEKGDYYTWTAVNVNNEKHIINYGVHRDYPHYAPNLYTNEAYKGCRQI